MTLPEFIDFMHHAADTYGFRAMGPIEDLAHYRDELIAHVRTRDFAMAHELHLRRRQADWTADDVRTFREMMLALQGPRTVPYANLLLPMIETGEFSGPLEFGMLSAMADHMMDFFLRSRQRDPTLEFVPMIELILLDGHTLATQVNRGERIAVLKTLAQQLPLYGYVLGFDGFLHVISQQGESAQRAEKLDAFVIQIGTREQRLARVRTYRVTPTGVVIDPPKPDIDLRDQGTDAQDPYASIFVSTPPTTTPQ